MVDTIPLFSRYPRLADRLPYMSLCELPTAIEPLAGLGQLLQIGGLYAKRDDRSAAGYGGNKVRKLEFLLADAVQKNRREVLTFGFAGSNFAAATALYGRRQGLDCLSMLLPQSPSDYVRSNLLVGRAAGATLMQSPSVPRLAVRALWQMAQRPFSGRPLPYWIPAGGSSPLGVCAYVNAALELAGQIEAGEVPVPDRIYVAMGSMGTVAGLAVGLHLAGLDSRVVAVRVVEKRFASARGLSDLIGRVIDLLGSDVVSRGAKPQIIGNIEVREEYFGGEYGHVPAETAIVMEQFAAETALRLDGTYSGKAATALVADAKKGALGDQQVILWHTFNCHPLQPLIGSITVRDLPAEFRDYFQTQVTDPSI